MSKGLISYPKDMRADVAERRIAQGEASKAATKGLGYWGAVDSKAARIRAEILAAGAKAHAVQAKPVQVEPVQV